MELMWDKATFPNLYNLVREGKVSLGRIDEAVIRILKVKFQLGLFEKPYADPKEISQQTHTPAGKALALEAAEKSAVLLKNKNLLPLDPAKIKNLAIIGPMAASVHLGGYAYEPFAGTSFLQGFTEYAAGHFKVSYAEGCKISTTPATFWGQTNPVPNSWKADERLIHEAVKTARSADAVILVIGEHESFARESGNQKLGDRDDLNLPGRQNDLVKALLTTGKPIIAIITGGRPLSFNLVAEKVPAIFQAWYLGEAGGTAMANLVFGKISPSGKLAISIPRNVGQLPVYYNHYPSLNTPYLFSDTSPLFVFGDGLSYTTFDYSDIKLSKKVIKVNESTVLSAVIKNTGHREATEIVQLYITLTASGIVRPVLELKDFKRVFLKPGQSKVVEFVIDRSKFSFINKDLKRVVQPGQVELKLGGSTRQLKNINLVITD